jgi:hypothetical protein
MDSALVSANHFRRLPGLRQPGALAPPRLPQDHPQARFRGGGVPEWSIGTVSKTVVPFTGYREFESLPLRQVFSRGHPASQGDIMRGEIKGRVSVRHYERRRLWLKDR